MPDQADLLIKPELTLRGGRVIRSLRDAITLLREHESRPGVDDRDEVLHNLERAATDQERHAAAQAFLAWVKRLDMLGSAFERVKPPS